MRKRRVGLWLAAFAGYAFLYVPLAIVVHTPFDFTSTRCCVILSPSAIGSSRLTTLKDRGEPRSISRRALVVPSPAAQKVSRLPSTAIPGP